MRIKTRSIKKNPLTFKRHCRCCLPSKEYINTRRDYRNNEQAAQEFKLTQKHIDTSLENIKKEEGYENFCEIIKALGSK